MMKKTISYFILLILALSLVACSDENPERFAGHGFDTSDEPISGQHQSFVGYVENISFDSRNSASGYLTLRGDPSDSGITPYIRVRIEEGVTESDISLPDLLTGQRVFVYHTLKGAAVLITMPLDASQTDVTHPPQSDSAFEIGRVRLASGDIEHEPGEHFLHGAMNTENGLLSASGIPFEFWLADNLDNLPEIQFVPGMQLMVDGEFGRIVTFPQEYPEYFGDYRLIGLLDENFVNGIATVTLPLNSGIYLVCVDVHWSGGGDEFTLLRYVFKLVRDFEPDDIPESSPSLIISIGAEGTELHRIRAAQGTTSWFPAFAFMDRIQTGDTVPGFGYEASGEHPLDFWRETWECIDFSAFRVDVGSGSNNIKVRLDFGFPPTSLSVRRWSTEFIGMASEMWNIYEAIEVTGNVFFIHNDGSDYIYEVVASWARGEHSFGSASYTFRLNAAS